MVVASSMSIYGEGGTSTPRRPAAPELAPRRAAREAAVGAARRARSRARPLATRRDQALLTDFGVRGDQARPRGAVPRGRQRVPDSDRRAALLQRVRARARRSRIRTPVSGRSSAAAAQPKAALIFEDGQQTRDFVHVSDIVRANVLALDTDRADYHAVNVGTGVATPIREVARILATGLGCPDEAEVLGRFREGDIRHCVADVSRARALLGYQPRVFLNEGMKELLDWVGEQDAVDLFARATAELEERRLLR